MYAMIRRYTFKTGTNQKTVDDFVKRIEEKFFPMTQEIRGFHSYAVQLTTNKELVTISLFEDRNGATESVRKAAEFVSKDPIKDSLSKPEILEGEVPLLKEAGVGVR
jgi:hypothetical protein